MGLNANNKIRCEPATDVMLPVQSDGPAVLLSYPSTLCEEQRLAFLHDVRGAVRTMGYLVDKLSKQYDQSEPAQRRLVESMRMHVGVIEDVKDNLIEPLFAQTLLSQSPCADNDDTTSP